jgi:hypothetical protein
MHTCPDCGKTMATLGGLEIHAEMSHAAPAPTAAPVAEPAPADVAEPLAVVDDFALEPRVVARTSRSSLRGYDPTVPLTALLVFAMLVAGIGTAVHRSGSSAHRLVSAAVSEPASPDAATTPTTIARPLGGAPASPAPPPAGSPASIPPAGSQPLAAAQSSGSCQSVIDSLPARPSKRSVDVADLMRANTFPALPLPGFEHPSVLGVTRYDTVQQFMADSFTPGDPTAAAWQANALAAGFVTAETIDFTNAGSHYGAAAFRFATPNGAMQFNRANFTASCGAGILDHAQAMPGLSGGMNYLIVEPGAPPYRAGFVAGDTVVRLNICSCVQAPDDQVLAGQWAQAVAARIAAG